MNRIVNLRLIEPDAEISLSPKEVVTGGLRLGGVEPPPGADPFNRWQERHFLDIEHQYARVWRRDVVALDVT